MQIVVDARGHVCDVHGCQGPTLSCIRWSASKFMMYIEEEVEEEEKEDEDDD